MASSARHSVQVPSSQVNLHCRQCENRIGKVQNEWIRLTASFVQPVHPGQHQGTDILTTKSQVVSAKISPSALEGCTMAPVSCTECSTVVGRYCQAVSSDKQNDMLNQYLYKLSKTCLKNSSTKEPVDPIYPHGKDLISTPPHTNQKPHHQGRHKPERMEYQRTTERAATEANPPASTSVGPQLDDDLSQSDEYTSEDPDRLSVLRVEGEMAHFDRDDDSRLAELEAKVQRHQNQIQQLLCVVDVLLAASESTQASGQGNASDGSMAKKGIPRQSGSVPTPQSVIAIIRNVQDKDRELEKLRAENTALKAKWEIVQSAMATASGTPMSNSTPANSLVTALGKRKRDSLINRPAPARESSRVSSSREPWGGQSSAAIHIPTPQSSTRSAPQPQDVSSSSRDPTSGDEQHEMDAHRITQTRVIGKNEARRPFVERPLQSTSKKPRLTQHDETTKTSSRVAHSVVRVPSIHRHRQENGATDAASTAVSLQAVSKSANHQKKPASQPTHEKDHRLDDDVAFSDEDEEEIQQDGSDHVAGAPLEQEFHNIPDDDSSDDFHDSRAATKSQGATNASKSAPARATRSKVQKTSSSSRRHTTGADSPFDDDDDTATQQPKLRELQARRRSADQAHMFEHSTLDTIEKEILETEESTSKSGLPRLPFKTRQLHAELRELGLEEWIDKDKHDPEYRRVVREARDRKIEADRMAKMAKRVATSQGARSLALASDEDAVPPRDAGRPGQAVEASAQRRAKSKAEREEDIRRRDELAGAEMGDD